MCSVVMYIPLLVLLLFRILPYLLFKMFFLLVCLQNEGEFDVEDSSSCICRFCSSCLITYTSHGRAPVM